jgi:hypothetical protein
MSQGTGQPAVAAVCKQADKTSMLWADLLMPATTGWCKPDSELTLSLPVPSIMHQLVKILDQVELYHMCRCILSHVQSGRCTKYPPSRKKRENSTLPHKIVVYHYLHGYFVYAMG